METVSRRMLATTALAFEGGLALLALGLGWLTGYPAWADWHANAAGVLLGMAACVPMLAGFALCLAAPGPPFQGLRRVADEIVRPLFARATLFDLFWIALLA